MRSRRPTTRHFNHEMPELRRFTGRHHSLLSIDDHGLNGKSGLVVCQFHCDRCDLEWKITSVADRDRSPDSFAVFPSVNPLTVRTVSQRHFDVRLKHRCQLLPERQRHAPCKHCVPCRYTHQCESENRDNNRCYSLNSCGIVVQPVHAVPRITESRPVANDVLSTPSTSNQQLRPTRAPKRRTAA